MVKRRGVTLAVLLVSALGALLGCGPEDGSNTNAPSTTAQRTETTAQRAEETSTVEPPPNVAEAAAAGIDGSSIRTHLSHLTGASPAPLEGGVATIAERGSVNGRRAAAEYMEQSFEEMGIPARILEFTSDEGRGFNVEATLRGTGGEKHLWVTAHLDSVGNAGANDDASGLASILMTARALKRLDPEHTVHFVAYDLEEVGLVGSSVYVRDTVAAVREQGGDRAIIGNINSDMIGYEPDRFDAVIGTCGRAGAIDDALFRASEMLDSQVKLREICLGRSDHQHFWDAGLSAAVLVEGVGYDGYPCYHKPCDTIDKLNLSYLRSVIQLTAAATALLAVPRSES
jgi:hypothetical protein